MTLTTPAPSPATPATPAPLPPVSCAPWCVDGTGHTDATFPEDQVCRGTTIEVELSRRPLIEVGEDTWARESVHLYLLRRPGALRSTVEVYRGELGETVSFAVDEAEAFGQALLDAVHQIRT